jgi:hypothetical protein
MREREGGRGRRRRTLELPDEELREVAGEDELPKGSAGSRDSEGSAVL